ncbi:MAG: hypothetical protein AB7I33_03770 [Gemmatimonadales bacterium]
MIVNPQRLIRLVLDEVADLPDVQELAAADPLHGPTFLAALQQLRRQLADPRQVPAPANLLADLQILEQLCPFRQVHARGLLLTAVVHARAWREFVEDAE